jgi:ribonuclease E
MSNNINKMLIDATHPEETRVVVLKNGRVEEFDFESAARKLLRGNIYLAKVTRVEPSLQAAFIDYGGNRHGFLAFSEIHPDYYQIPVADRQALLDEQAAQEAAEEAEVDAHAERLARRRDQRQREQAVNESETNEPEFVVEPDDVPRPEVIGEASTAEPHADDDFRPGEPEGHNVEEVRDDDREPQRLEAMPADVRGDEHISEPAAPGETEAMQSHTNPAQTNGDQNHHDLDHQHHASGHAPDHHHDHDHHEHGHVELLSPAALETLDPVDAEDIVEERPMRPRRRARSYKIQEVIKRRQVILVQVVKEERGNKGAALTTYLSLAGRYTVLMPNTARGGGISKKISEPKDRKRLKAIANELEVPEGMGLIIRTAGASRTSQEIKRDFEYLLRLWESVRELTLASTAPSLVYEEGNLIKRSIRDLYTKDVEEVVVAGEVAHGEARDFMRMLMPSHAQNVIEYKGAEPLFTRYRMEQQLAAMFSPQVTLKSGGYLVINQTEALVAIDVNSGKSTREYSIEETALNTNLEASDEIARQLKLRDLAGLIVIDFIDMEEKRNNRSVERRLKDALRFDRARIQLGRISHFGLMEMSRQRLRTGVLEGSTSQCPHCQGTGIIRSIESIALAVIRGLEDALMSGTRMALIATTTPQIALFILNAKRAYITDMEARHGLSITIQGSDKLQGANFTIDKVAATTAENPLRRRSSSAVNMEWGFDGETAEDAAMAETFVEPAVYEGEEDAPVARAPRHEHRGRGEGRSEARGEGRSEARSDARGEGRREPQRDAPRDPQSEFRGEPGSNDPATEEGRRKRRRRGRRGRRDDRGPNEIGMSDRGPVASNSNVGDDGYDDADQIIEIGGEDAGDDSVGGADDGNTAASVRVGGDGRGQQRPGDGTDAEGRERRGRRRGRRGGRRGGQNRERTPLAANDAVALDRDVRDQGDDQPYADQSTAAHHSAYDNHARSDLAARGDDEPEHADAPTATQADALHAPRERAERHSRAPRPHRDDKRSEETRSEEAGREETRNAVALDVRTAPAPAIPVDEHPVPPTVPMPAAVAMTPTSAVEPVPVKPRRSAESSSEPVLERVVVSPTAAGDATPSGEPAKPTRKGWWQKKLGLD